MNFKKLTSFLIICISLMCASCQHIQPPSQENTRNLDKDNLILMVNMTTNTAYLDKISSFTDEFADYFLKNEPATLSYNFYFSEDKKNVTLIEIYKNEEAALLHINNLSNHPMFQEFVNALSFQNISVYGPISDNLKKSEFMKSLKPTYKD